MSRENICTLLSIISLKKNIFCSSHIKIAYTKIHNSKINQSIFRSSWVLNLAKCMCVMYENNERYDCKMQDGYRKKNLMHLNPITNDAWKN